MEAINLWLEHGIERVILGTVAMRNPEFVKQACKLYPGKIEVGIDAREGLVSVEGWSTNSMISAVELASRFEDSGVAAIIFTDINRDGALTGVNIHSTESLAESVSTPIIASGGVSSLSDLRILNSLETKGIIGVIVGRALYEKRFDLREALAVLKNHDEDPC